MTPLNPLCGAELAAHLQGISLWHQSLEDVSLGFGDGQDQFAFITCEPPGPGETLGLFFEWHTQDFFALAPGSHLAVGLNGPLSHDPHRGRGLAIGQFAGTTPENDRVLFDGCPPFPGGPSGFLEEFTINEGTAPITDWQLTPGLPLPGLQDDAVIRVDIHVSALNTYAAAWRIDGDVPGLLGQWSGRAARPFSDDRRAPVSSVHREDIAVGNVFIGSAFGAPQTRSVIRHGWLACWRD